MPFVAEFTTDAARVRRPINSTVGGDSSGQYPSRPAPAHRWPTIIVRSALGRDFVG